MSNPALNWAFQQRTGSSSAKLILITLADLADKKTHRAFPSVAEICFRTELNRKTVLTAMATLEASGLIVDTGERVGRTKLIPIYRVSVPPETNGPENGPVSSETVPILRGNGPVFTSNGPENGLRTPSNPSLTKEGKPPKATPRFENEIHRSNETLKARRNLLFKRSARENSMYGTSWTSLKDKAEWESINKQIRANTDELASRKNESV